MRIIADESRIQNRTRIGERAPFIGLIIIFATTILVISRRELVILSTVLVTIGFTITLIGSYLGERFVGALAHYKKVPEALKGLDNQYTLLMYKTPLPFVLIEPECVTVITVKSHGGNVEFSNGRWRHKEKFGFWRRLAGQESLGQPHRLAEAEAEEMEHYLKKRLPVNVEVPVRPLLLFINPNVILEAEASPVPAVRMPQAKRWIRKTGELTKMPKETQEQLFEALGLDS